jgi:hypothetical protein
LEDSTSVPSSAARPHVHKLPTREVFYRPFLAPICTRLCGANILGLYSKGYFKSIFGEGPM